MSKPNISVACQWTQDDTSMLLFPYIWHKLTQFIATTRSARSAGQSLPQPSPSSSTPINTPSIYINSATLPRCLPRASHRPLCFCHPLLPQNSFSNTSNSHSLGLADGKVVKSGDCHPLPLPLHDDNSCGGIEIHVMVPAKSTTPSKLSTRSRSTKPERDQPQEIPTRAMHGQAQ